VTEGEANERPSLRRLWSLYAKALGARSDGLSDCEADLVAIFRTIIFGVPGICIILNTLKNFGII
jgi:hypothetical protein